jgi:hypothetical protein
MTQWPIKERTWRLTFADKGGRPYRWTGEAPTQREAERKARGALARCAGFTSGARLIAAHEAEPAR